MDDQVRANERLCFGSEHLTVRNPLSAGSDATLENGSASPFTLRDLLTVGFRHSRLVVNTFIAIFLAAFLLVLLRPARYEAEMKILVKRERVDPLVTPEESSRQPTWLGVTEEELNSEVELLKSRDMLAQVVVASRLHEQNRSGIRDGFRNLMRSRAEEPARKERKIAYAVQQAAGHLKVQPLRKSNVIRVSYTSQEPELAATVLKTLAERYLDKHLAVHRPSGAFDFFELETQRYGGQLALVQARLSQHNREQGVVSAQAEKEAALRQFVELEATEQATQAQIAETTQRVRALQAQLASTPVRTTTEVHRGSSRLLEQLHGTLLTHELKRIELLRVFQPDYPPVQEVEAQIGKIQAAIAAAERSPLLEETTDRNPTYDYLLAELAKGRSELAGLQARAEATGRSVVQYREKARRLEQVGLVQQDFVRTATQAEQSYLIYARKKEEARISNALDDQRILNVAIAEEATVPLESSGVPKLLLLLLGALFAGLVSIGLACVVDYLDPSFRTPDEVQAFLGSPVLASIPRNAV